MLSVSNVVVNEVSADESMGSEHLTVDSTSEDLDSSTSSLSEKYDGMNCFSLSAQSIEKIVSAEKPKLNFLISVGQEYHKTECQESIFDLIDKIKQSRLWQERKKSSPIEIEIVVAGTLQAYNTENEPDKGMAYWKAQEARWVREACEKAARRCFTVSGSNSYQFISEGVNIRVTPWESLKAEVSNIGEKDKKYTTKEAFREIVQGGSTLSNNLYKKIERYVLNDLSKTDSLKKPGKCLLLGIQKEEVVYDWDSFFLEQSFDTKGFLEKKAQERYTSILNSYVLNGESFVKKMNDFRLLFPYKKDSPLVIYSEWLDALNTCFSIKNRPLPKKESQLICQFEFLEKELEKLGSTYEQLDEACRDYSNLMGSESATQSEFCATVPSKFQELHGIFLKDFKSFLSKSQDFLKNLFKADKGLFNEFCGRWAQQRIKVELGDPPSEDYLKALFIKCAELYVDCDSGKKPFEAVLKDVLTRRDPSSKNYEKMLESFINYNLEEMCFIFDYIGRRDSALNFDQFLLYPSEIDGFFNVCNKLDFSSGTKSAPIMEWVSLKNDLLVPVSEVIEECSSLDVFPGLNNFIDTLKKVPGLVSSAGDELVEFIELFKDKARQLACSKKSHEVGSASVGGAGAGYYEYLKIFCDISTKISTKGVPNVMGPAAKAASSTVAPVAKAKLLFFLAASKILLAAGAGAGAGYVAYKGGSALMGWYDSRASSGAPNPPSSEEKSVMTGSRDNIVARVSSNIKSFFPRVSKESSETPLLACVWGAN